MEQGGDKLGMRTLRVTWANSSTQGGGRGGGGGAARPPPLSGPMSVEDVSAQTGDANRTVYVAGLGTDGEVTMDEDGAVILHRIVSFAAIRRGSYIEKSAMRRNAK